MAYYDSRTGKQGTIQRAGVITTGHMDAGTNEEEIARVAELAEQRRIRANLMERGLEVQDPALSGGKPAVRVEHRTIKDMDGNNLGRKPYLVNEDGAITVAVTNDRPFTDEEWKAVGDAAQQRRLYAPEARARGNGYAESGYLDDATLAARRQERYGDQGTGSIARSARAARIRRAFAEERAYGNGPSARQQAAQERWDAERAARSKYPNERNAQRAMAAENRTHEWRRAQLDAETQRHGADAQVRASEAKGLSDQKVAEIQQKGALSLEELRGMNAKQLQELLNQGNLAVAQVEGDSRVGAARETAAGVLGAAQANARSAEREAQLAQQKQLNDNVLTYIRMGGKVDPQTLSALGLMKSPEDFERIVKSMQEASGGDPAAAQAYYDQYVGPYLNGGGNAQPPNAPQAPNAPQPQGGATGGGQQGKQDGRGQWASR